MINKETLRPGLMGSAKHQGYPPPPPPSLFIGELTITKRVDSEAERFMLTLPLELRERRLQGEQ